MRTRPLTNQDFLLPLYTGKLIQQVLITIPTGHSAGRELQERTGAPCFPGTRGFGYTWSTHGST
jgi:hypothetical protein